MISVCIITKNETAKLERCLASFQPYPFEIVVVDTGSTDNSKEIAKSYTEHVYDFEWCDDFSAVRNYCASKASNDSILVVDSDEYICDIDSYKLNTYCYKHPFEVGSIKIMNKMAGDTEQHVTAYVPRIYNRKYFHFEGKVHEQIVSLNNTKIERYHALITLHHDGYAYTGEKMKQKFERNVKILEKCIEAGENLLYNYYQLGKTYFLNYQFENAIPYFEKALSSTSSSNSEFIFDCMESYGYSLLYSGQAKTALQLKYVYDEFKSSADFVFLMGLIYLETKQYSLALDEFKKVLTYSKSKVSGITTYLSNYRCGNALELLGDVETAKTYYKKCGDFAPAKEALERLSQ